MKFLAQIYATLDKLYSPARFNRLYRLQFDPYETLTSASELCKQAVIMELISGRNYHSALDVGCGLGHLTRRLSSVCRQVVGIDFSSAAIDQARRYSPGDSQISFQVADVRQFDGFHQYDLILCSEVLYYLQADELDLVIQRLMRFASPGASLVMVGRADDTYVLPRLAARISLVACRSELNWSRPFMVSLFKLGPVQEANLDAQAHRVSHDEP